MAKLTLNPVQSGFYSTALLNQNFSDIEAAIENTLSRDGSIPNSMTASLDLNSNDILNVDRIDATSLVLGGELVLAKEPLFTAVSASQVSYLPEGNGAVITDVQTKLRENVSVKDFGAVGNGVTDDTAAIQKAADSLAPYGGTVLIPNGMKCLIDNNLTVPSNITIKGPHTFVGSPQDNALAPYNDMGGALIINSTKTITLKGGAGISGLLIYRKGMVFPAPDASAFAGTAITADDDDVTVERSMILGFSKAFYSFGNQRPRMEYVYMDCINGIEIGSCYDIAYVSNCHAWPFASIAQVGATIIRSGVAFYFYDVGDWSKLTNCFSWGYSRGIRIVNCSSVTVLNCGFDNWTDGTPLNTNSIGIELQGNCYDTRLIGCQTAAQDVAGIFINLASDNFVTIDGHNCWGNSDHGILLYSGNVSVINSGYRDITHVLSVTNSDSRVQIMGNWFWNISQVVNASVLNVSTWIGQNNFGNFGGIATSENVKCGSVASSAAILLPNSGNVFYVNGTTNFGTLQHGWHGRTVTLIFTGELIVLHGTVDRKSMVLKGGANFSTVANNTLTLTHNGIHWYETARSA